MEKKMYLSKPRDSVRRKTSPSSFVEPLESRMLRSAGQLDPSFGTGGISLVSDGYEDASSAVALTRSTVAGETAVLISSGELWSFALLRDDGQIVRSFGDNGVATQTFGVFPERANGQYGAQAIASDGNRLIAVGSDSTYSSAASLPVLDIINATTGATIVAAEQQIFPLDAYYDAVAIQADHKIVVAGQASIDGKPLALLVRYLPSGQLDTTFDAAGIVESRFVGTDNGFSSLALQPDGKIVAVGYTNGGRGADRMIVARYSSNGTLDRTFSTGGWIQAFPSTYSAARTVAITGDGKILVSGAAVEVTGNEFATDSYFVQRLNADSSRDQTFNGGLTLSTRPLYSSEDFDSVLNFLQVARLPLLPMADGSLLVSNRRITAEGHFDSSYGYNGLAPTLPLGLIALPDGRILEGQSNPRNPPTDYTPEPAVAAVLGDGAVIEGSAFHDANGNAKQDSGEPTSLANVASVYLDQNNNGKQDPGEPAAELFADGSFAFYGLSPGSYVVRETLDAGVKQTTPAANSGITVTLKSGQVRTGLLFGSR